MEVTFGALLALIPGWEKVSPYPESVEGMGGIPWNTVATLLPEHLHEDFAERVFDAPERRFPSPAIGVASRENLVRDYATASVSTT